MCYHLSVMFRFLNMFMYILDYNTCSTAFTCIHNRPIYVFSYLAGLTNLKQLCQHANETQFALKLVIKSGMCIESYKYDLHIEPNIFLLFYAYGNIVSIVYKMIMCCLSAFPTLWL